MKVLRNLVSIVSAVSFLLCLMTLFLILLGYRPYVLKTQSMEPEYRQGSLCWVNTRVDLDHLNIGDPVVYRSPANSLVLHRLIDISPSDQTSLSVIMKGDANTSEQAIELSHVNYIGREAFTMPELGIFVDALVSHHVLWFIAPIFVILACIPWESIHFQEKDVAER